MKLCYLFSCLALATLINDVSTFVDVSSQVFKSGTQNRNGILAAFGDFDGDKKVDLFVVSDSGKTLKIFLSLSLPPFYHEPSFTCSYNFPGSYEITSIVPGDFDGDTNMDAMMSIKEKAGSITKVKILWGFKSNIECAEDKDSYISMKGQPLALDYNGDAQVDLLGENEAGERSFWTFNNKTAVERNFFNHKDLKPLSYPHSNSFVDLNGDLDSDIFITSTDKFEFWINQKEKFVLEKSVAPPAVDKFYQVSFCDIDASGSLNIIVPVCKSKNCEDSQIQALYKDKWEVVGSDFVYNDKKWKFSIPDAVDSELIKSMQQPTFRIADINMDGFPDLLTIMYSVEDNNVKSAVFIMYNKASDTNSFGRKFEISNSIDIENANLAALHDIFEDGRMDILVNTMTSLKDVKLHAFRYTTYYDAYFLKVIVLSGVCKDSCPHDRMSYGTNIPGSCVRIDTISSETFKRYSYMNSFPKSAYFALNLPYMIFGLGQTPNFVEKLEIGLPTINNKTTSTSYWNQIIPNSQVVIVPYPLDSSSSWYMKLFVTASKLILITAGALIGTCLFIVLIILFLHWREKREDRKEKQQDAHRFHFNAM